jgi:hypothetical protein
MEDTRNLEENMIAVPSLVPPKPKRKSVIITRKGRYSVFLFFMIMELFVNFDQGYFPAATEEFKEDFGVHDSSLLGLYGSSLYVGNLIGNKCF